MAVNIHGTCLAIGKTGILLRGPSGAGKSDLALRLIMQEKAKLVADDQVLVELKNSRIIGSAPANLKGLLEVRGQGILKFPAIAQTQIHGVVDLLPIAAIARLPEPEDFQAMLLGQTLPRLKLWAEGASATARIAIFLKHISANSFSLAAKKR